MSEWPMPERDTPAAPIRARELEDLEVLLREDEIPQYALAGAYRNAARRLLGEVYRLQQALERRDKYIAYLERQVAHER